MRSAVGVSQVLSPLASGCSRPETALLEPVLRLTEHVRGAATKERPRCKAGDELRPSLGCPPLFGLKTQLSQQTRAKLEALGTIE